MERRKERRRSGQGAAPSRSTVPINKPTNTSHDEDRQADCSTIISHAWDKQPNAKHFCVATRSATKEWKEHTFKNTPKLAAELRAFVAEHGDKDIWFCPQGFSQAARRREYAVEPCRLLWADMDASDPRKLTGVMRPSVAIESSPGRYVGLWVCDKPASNDVNRRLTYAIGADKSGWDLTQLLRVPGTKNFKYGTMPIVRVLWSDGPEIKLDELLEALPPDIAGGPSSENAQELYAKYEQQMGSPLRQELMRKKVLAGDRSKAIHKMCGEMLECGIPLDDAFVLAMSSALVRDKFKDRKDAEDVVREGLLKLQREKLRGGAKVGDARDSDDPDQEPEYVFGETTMAQVEEEEYDWVWEPFLARGEMTPLDGLPEAGKSFLAQMISKWICDGEEKTPNHKSVKQGRVLYFDFENSKDKSTKVRLLNMDCKNMGRFHIEDTRFTIDDAKAMVAIEQACERIKPDLVVFDTLNRYLPRGTKNDDSIEMTHAQDQFVDIARTFNCAVLVLRHLNKSENQSANNRVMGTISNRGVSRLGMAAAEYADDDHPYEEKHRGMMSNKSNDGPGSSMITYRIVAADKPGPGKLVWGGVVEDVNLDELYASTWAKAKKKETDPDGDDGDGRKRKPSPKLDQAKIFIRDFCGAKPQLKEVVVKMAAEEGISESTLVAAHDQLIAAGIVELIRCPANGRGQPKKKWFAPKATLTQQALDLVEKHQATSRTQALLDEAKENEIDVAYIDRALPRRKLSEAKETLQ